MIEYGLTKNNQDIIREKSKTKKDGCYSFRGIIYRVKSGRVPFLASGGEVYEDVGAYNVVVGIYDINTYSVDKIKKLLQEGIQS